MCKSEKVWTGYPSIDKPQNKYYREVPIREINTGQTIYELIFNSNSGNMNDEAIGYLGITWTFEKLKHETDRAADAFYQSGLRMGDTVLVGVSNSPEIVVLFLALNKIGVVTKWFDIRANESDIKEYIKAGKCKYVVVSDILTAKMANIIDSVELERVIIIDPSGSLSKLKNTIYNIKAKKEGNISGTLDDERYVKWYDFVKRGNRDSAINCVDFDAARPSIMIQSSGTTGKPKTIIHSDFSCTACVQKIAYLDHPLGRGKQILVALPPWIAYGIGNAILMPLALGSKIELCPTFEPDVVMKNIGKFTLSYAAPFHYRYLRDNFDKLSKKTKEKFQKVECMVSGGDKISIEENEEFEKIFNTSLVNGYGNNEGWGVLTANPTQRNKYGTVGIPKYRETIISYDNENQTELQYGESGEICALIDTLFLEYEFNVQETSAVKKKHKDGKIWLHTGDIGFIDEDGFLHLGGRARRVIVRGGFKISAYTIEDKVSEHEAVKECVAVEVKDSEDEHAPMVFMVLKDGFEDKESFVYKEVLNKCQSELKEYEVPKHLKIVDKLPYTQNGKYDFRLLEEWGNEFVDEL